MDFFIDRTAARRSDRPTLHKFDLEATTTLLKFTDRIALGAVRSRDFSFNEKVYGREKAIPSPTFFRPSPLKFTLPAGRHSPFTFHHLPFIIHHSQLNIAVVIPAYNEEKSIGLVLSDIPKDYVNEVIVCNNNSKDKTREAALAHGATVVDQPLPGYGNACLKGIEYLKNKPQSDQPDIVVFLDGDYSDHPEEMPDVVRPITEGGYDMVIGSRALGVLEKGAMQPQQIFGNWLATNLIRLFFKYHFTDLGPFRAIRWDKLVELNMEDKNFGWTVEMQVKAAKQKLRCTEVPVNYRQRIGVSKVSGTLRGSILAGHKILWTIFKSI